MIQSIAPTSVRYWNRVPWSATRKGASRSSTRPQPEGTEHAEAPLDSTLLANDEPLVIPVSDLRDALTRLLEAATERFGPLVDLDADHYWAIEPDAAFDIAKDPPVAVGQLSDDVSTVRDLLARDDGEVFLWHDLEHAIGILQRIASLARP